MTGRMGRRASRRRRALLVLRRPGAPSRRSPTANRRRSAREQPRKSTTSITSAHSPRSSRRSRRTRRTRRRYRGLAIALWLSITFRRGNMTVDDYLGPRQPSRTRRRHRRPRRPPPRFERRIDQALALARKRVEANPRDADAHYQIGAAVGLRASYIATIEGSAVGGVPRRARGVRRARKSAQSRSAPQGRRSHRRHVSLHRLGARAAAALGRPIWRDSAAARSAASG